MIRGTIIPVIVDMIAKEFQITEEQALERFYMSNTGALLADDETGLYGQSPLYIFGLYLEEMKHKKDKKKE